MYCMKLSKHTVDPSYSQNYLDRLQPESVDWCIGEKWKKYQEDEILHPWMDWHAIELIHTEQTNKTKLQYAAWTLKMIENWCKIGILQVWEKRSPHMDCLEEIHSLVMTYSFSICVPELRYFHYVSIFIRQNIGWSALLSLLSLNEQ